MSQAGSFCIAEMSDYDNDVRNKSLGMITTIVADKQQPTSPYEALQ